MAARVLRKQEVADAAKAFVSLHPEYECSSNERGFIIMPGNVQVSCSPEGKLDCNNPEIHDKLIEIIMDMEPVRAPNPAPKTSGRANVPAPMRNGQGKGLDTLTPTDIIQYINPKATEADAWLFLRFCQEKHLNPITKEAYLVIFEGKDGRQVSIITGKEAFTKKAEAHGQFDGFKAGVVVRNEAGQIEFDREGTFLLPKEELLGGWAEVMRKDRKTSFKSQVSFKEFNTGRKLWNTMPATMIRKVALVQALREAFPADLGGCYDRAEMDQAIEAEYEVRG